MRARRFDLLTDRGGALERESCSFFSGGFAVFFMLKRAEVGAESAGKQGRKIRLLEGGRLMAANSEKTARGRGRPFEKGKSGNPNGRPKQTQEEKDALAMIRELAPTAAEKLKEILLDKGTKHETALKAIEIVLERTYGKPVAYDPASGNVTNALLQSLIELERQQL